MQVTPLGDPAFPLDQVLMHDGDLPGPTSEADEAEFEPVPEGLAKGYWLWTFLRLFSIFHESGSEKAS
jgi:hypothetical protein